MPNTALIFSNNITYSGSRPQMFFKIGVRKNFANFTGKHLCWSPFLIKLQRLQHRCFPVKLPRFLRTPPVAASVHIVHTDVRCNLSRWNNGYKERSIKAKTFRKKEFFKKKFYIISHFLSLYVFISIQNIGQSVPLIVGGGKGHIADFRKNTLKFILIIIIEWPKKTPLPISCNVDNFSLVHFIRSHSSIRHKRVG